MYLLYHSPRGHLERLHESNQRVGRRMSVEEDYVLDDNGHWVTRYENAAELARRGVLYGQLAQPKRQPGYTVQDPKPYKHESFNYMPYRGFDHKRFPRTFLTLLMFYHQPDWFREGKMVGGPYRDVYGPTKTESQTEDKTQEESRENS